MQQISADTRKKLPPLKPILALPTLGQKCFVLEVDYFEIPDFDLGHPVRNSHVRSITIILRQYISQKENSFFSCLAKANCKTFIAKVTNPSCLETLYLDFYVV